eukprot:scaffold1006_cov270-Pinguiococcus_pyrenoidosus.AAC.10
MASAKKKTRPKPTEGQPINLPDASWRPRSARACRTSTLGLLATRHSGPARRCSCCSCRRDNRWRAWCSDSPSDTEGRSARCRRPCSTAGRSRKACPAGPRLPS